MKNRKLNGVREAKPAYSSSSPEVERRIEAVADLFETRKTAASVAGISTDQLTAYIKGTSRPALAPIARIAEAQGVRLDWIWSGEGPMRERTGVSAEQQFTDRELDDLQEDVRDAVRALLVAKKQISPELVAGLVRIAWNIRMKQGSKMDDSMLSEIIQLANFRK